MVLKTASLSLIMRIEEVEISGSIAADGAVGVPPHPAPPAAVDPGFRCADPG
jgi:hypothetical protein